MSEHGLGDVPRGLDGAEVAAVRHELPASLLYAAEQWIRHILILHAPAGPAASSAVRSK